MPLFVLGKGWTPASAAAKPAEARRLIGFLPAAVAVSLISTSHMRLEHGPDPSGIDIRDAAIRGLTGLVAGGFSGFSLPWI